MKALSVLADLIIIVFAASLIVGAVASYYEKKKRVKQLAEVTDFIQRIGLGDRTNGLDLRQDCDCDEEDCIQCSSSGVTPWYVELGPDGHD